jgi:hypothetical protein
MFPFRCQGFISPPIPFFFFLWPWYFLLDLTLYASVLCQSPGSLDVDHRCIGCCCQYRRYCRGMNLPDVFMYRSTASHPPVDDR